MNERITINNDITVWGTLKKRDYPKKWHGDARAMDVNVFTIHFRKDDNEVTFTFYDSPYNCSRGVTKLDSDALKNAVDAILSDSLCATYSFEDYCDEYCHDSFDPQARKIYNGCRECLDKVLTLMDIDSIYTVLNNL
jgi:hypothetical protein